MMRETTKERTSCRILVIDDDTYVAEFFKAFIKLCFPGNLFSMKVVVDLEQGRGEISKNEYDILFLNPRQPGVDCQEALDAVGQAVRMGKLVVITGEIGGVLKESVRSLGIERCLSKPFDLEEIKEIVGGSSAFARAKKEHCNNKAT